MTTQSAGRVGLVAAQVRREAMDAAALHAVADDQHLGELALGALGRAAPQMAFAAFGANQLAGSRHPKSLGGCLVGLEFVLFGHSCAPAWRSSTRQYSTARSVRCWQVLQVASGQTSVGYFFLSLSGDGARTINMVLPSMFGACSTMAIS